MNGLNNSSLNIVKMLNRDIHTAINCLVLELIQLKELKMDIVLKEPFLKESNLIFQLFKIKFLKLYLNKLLKLNKYNILIGNNIINSV